MIYSFEQLDAVVSTVTLQYKGPCSQGVFCLPCLVGWIYFSRNILTVLSYDSGNIQFILVLFRTVMLKNVTF